MVPCHVTQNREEKSVKSIASVIKKMQHSTTIKKITNVALRKKKHHRYQLCAYSCAVNIFVIGEQQLVCQSAAAKHIDLVLWVCPRGVTPHFTYDVYSCNVGMKRCVCVNVRAWL